MALVRTNVSVERIASIIRVTKIGGPVTTTTLVTVFKPHKVNAQR
jgi:hypothetical protein